MGGGDHVPRHRAHRKRDKPPLSPAERWRFARQPPCGALKEVPRSARDGGHTRSPAESVRRRGVVRQGEKSPGSCCAHATPRRCATTPRKIFFSLSHVSDLWYSISPLCECCTTPKTPGPGDTGQEREAAIPAAVCLVLPCYGIGGGGGGSGNGGAVRSLAQYAGTQDGDPSGWVGCLFVCLCLSVSSFLLGREPAPGPVITQEYHGL